VVYKLLYFTQDIKYESLHYLCDKPGPYHNMIEKCDVRFITDENAMDEYQWERKKNSGLIYNLIILDSEMLTIIKLVLLLLNNIVDYKRHWLLAGRFSVLVFTIDDNYIL